MSYSCAGDTATQVVCVFGSNFTCAGSRVTGGTPNLILGTDNGTPAFEVRVYGVTDASIQKLASLSFADQVDYLASGDDTLEDGPGTTGIDGGAGFDTARPHFNFVDARFRYESGTLEATAPQHQDRIVNVERFQFDDRTFDSLAALEKAAGVDDGLNPVYRFYDASSGVHHYAPPDEAASIRAGSAGAGWVDGGPASSSTPRRGRPRLRRARPQTVGGALRGAPPTGGISPPWSAGPRRRSGCPAGP